MTPRRKDIVAGIIVALMILHAARGSGVGIVAPKATAAVYVYEQRSGEIPNAVLAAIDKLNRQNIVATTFDVDTTNGGEQVPAQYAAAVPAAKEAGLPALVVSAGLKVLRTVKAPQTEDDVLGAVK